VALRAIFDISLRAAPHWAAGTEESAGAERMDG
jgi:hypothetical protein